MTDENMAELGEIVIAPEVLEIIVGIAVSQIEGVHSLRSSRPLGNVGRKSEGHGVAISAENDKVIADIHVYLSYGAKVPQVAGDIQREAKDKVFRQTNVTIDEVNVHVLGIVASNEKKPAFEDLFKEGFFDVK